MNKKKVNRFLETNLEIGDSLADKLLTVGKILPDDEEFALNDSALENDMPDENSESKPASETNSSSQENNILKKLISKGATPKTYRVKTFYLSDDVLENISKYAKLTGKKSDSQFLQDLLTEIFKSFENSN